MKVGDIVLYEGARWLVRSYDKMTRTVMLNNIAGAKKELAAELDVHAPDVVKVICNPGQQWSVLPVKVKSGAGPFIQALYPQPLMRKDVELIPWVDWIPSDPFREGGSVFINPKVGLRTGDLVLFRHSKGSQVRATVPATFGTVSKMKLAKSPPLKPVVTRFSHILDGNDDD